MYKKSTTFASMFGYIVIYLTYGGVGRKIAPPFDKLAEPGSQSK